MEKKKQKKPQNQMDGHENIFSFSTKFLMTL